MIKPRATIAKAETLAEATRPALPKRKTQTHKPRPVALTYDRFIQALRISEVKSGAFQTTIQLAAPAEGWHEDIIVDGVSLARVAASFPAGAEVTLSYDEGALVVQSGTATIKITRIHLNGA